jgi:hypothetical protein
MVSLGRPGVGAALLQGAGFRDVERVDLPFVWEFADPEAYARALASTGPAFEAIQAVGDASFLEAAVELARERVRDGLPLGRRWRWWPTSPASRVSPGRVRRRLRPSSRGGRGERARGPPGRPLHKPFHEE